MCYCGFSWIDDTKNGFPWATTQRSLKGKVSFEIPVHHLASVWLSPLFTLFLYSPLLYQPAHPHSPTPPSYLTHIPPFLGCKPQCCNSLNPNLIPTTYWNIAS